MEGEDGDSENPRAFSNAVWWKRFIILVAGAAMNFITGVVMIGIFLAPNKNYILPQISVVEENCAFADYIQPGDTIVALDGEKIYVNSDFSLLMSLNAGDIHDLTIRRNGEIMEYKNINMMFPEFRMWIANASLEELYHIEETTLNIIKKLWEEKKIGCSFYCIGNRGGRSVCNGKRQK